MNASSVSECSDENFQLEVQNHVSLFDGFTIHKTNVMAQAEFDDPTNLLASLSDDQLEEVFAFLGPCYIHLALTCRKFNSLLLEN
jgi:hypothetical protein